MACRMQTGGVAEIVVITYWRTCMSKDEYEIPFNVRRRSVVVLSRWPELGRSSPSRLFVPFSVHFLS